MDAVSFAAVDLGATSGRVMVAQVGPKRLRIEQVARFPNGPVQRADGLHWDFTALRRHVFDGLRVAGAGRDIRSIGIDSWAVDYGLLVDGQLRDDPFHYRDARTSAGVAAVHARVSPARLHAQNGLQVLPFNSLYQLAADRDVRRLDDAESALLIPDLFAYLLTGLRVAERTNASTTGLLTLATSVRAVPAWNDPLIATLGLPRRLFARLANPGEPIGPLSATAAGQLGYGTAVTAVGSHDTASAVVAAPMTDPDAAYISCGTWGLVGVELEAPVLTDASREANFTNELGVDGRIRYLRNVMGLWLLNESVAIWAAGGHAAPLRQLLAEAAAIRSPVPVFDVNDPRFLSPGDMPARISACLRERGSSRPQSPAAIIRSIIESLADAFAQTLREASSLSGKRVTRVHIVGGGSQIALLCQATADRSGLPVFAGPVEATAMGNVLVQARAQGAIRGDLETLRALVARTVMPVKYSPRAQRRSARVRVMGTRE